MLCFQMQGILHNNLSDRSIAHEPNKLVLGWGVGIPTAGLKLPKLPFHVCFKELTPIVHAHHSLFFKIMVGALSLN